MAAGTHAHTHTHSLPWNECIHSPSNPAKSFPSMPIKVAPTKAWPCARLESIVNALRVPPAKQQSRIGPSKPISLTSSVCVPWQAWCATHDARRSSVCAYRKGFFFCVAAVKGRQGGQFRCTHTLHSVQCCRKPDRQRGKIQHTHTHALPARHPRYDGAPPGFGIIVFARICSLASRLSDVDKDCRHHCKADCTAE